MASESSSYRFSELETLSYDNAETWFTRMQSILDARDSWTPVFNIIQIRQGVDEEEPEWDDNSLLSPQVASLQSSTRSNTSASRNPTPVEGSLGPEETEKEKVRKLIKKKDWLKGNKTAIAILLGWISRTDINVVKEYRFAGDIWLHLKETYEQKNQVVLVKALTQFLTWEMRPDQRILAAVNEVRYLAAQIPELGGDPQSELTMTVVLLKGLTSSFENYRQALQLQELGFNQVVESLKMAEASMSTEASVQSDTKVNRASTSRCYNCGRHGHLKRDCPEASGSSSEDDKKKTRKSTKAAKQFDKLK